ncbi:MAG: glycosyltransferase family 4 protein [Methanophagales archaeon]|nr:glycosyltransferase family 4 protein [Methanophagales archaeon]
MRKIKVVMLGPYLYEMGGVTMHIKKLTKYLARRDDIELHLITVSTKNEKYEKDNLNIHVIKKRIPYPFSIPSVTWRLRRKILEINPEIVHAQGTIVSYSTAAALVQNKYPILLTVHGIGSMWIKYSKGIDFIYQRLFSLPNERYVLSKIPNIITVSPQAKDWFSNMTNANVYVISNGVDFEDIQNVEPHKSIKHPSIFFVGVLGNEKGIDVLLKAIPIIKEKIPNTYLYIGGAGQQEKELKKLAKELNIEENVKFLGYISEEEKYAYYKAVDVCAIPSRLENEPIVLLEAMACETPVVASNVGGISFVIEDGKTGLLVEPENIGDLADKIVILLEDEKLRRKMSEAGRERVKEFTWDKIAEQTVEVYKEILEGI